MVVILLRTNTFQICSVTKGSVIMSAEARRALRFTYFVVQTDREGKNSLSLSHVNQNLTKVAIFLNGDLSLQALGIKPKSISISTLSNPPGLRNIGLKSNHDHQESSYIPMLDHKAICFHWALLL